MAELVVIRGLPGSGKSSLAKKNYPNHLHYEPDHLFCDTKGEYLFYPEFKRQALDWTYKMTDYALARGRDVVVADVFPRASDVREYLELAEFHSATHEVITCEGNYKNVHGVPKHVWEGMYDNFETIK